MPARATAAISPLTPRQIGAVAAGAGVFNSQHCFPATQRKLRHLARPRAPRAGRDARLLRDLDVRRRPGADRGQALFSFNSDPEVVKAFHTKYGVRTFDGRHPYDGSEGWAAFLAVQFRPVLDNALREASAPVPLRGAQQHVRLRAGLGGRRHRQRRRRQRQLAEPQQGAGRDRHDAGGRSGGDAGRPVLRERAVPRAETLARADGSLAVVLVRDDDPHVRTVRELARDLGSIELAAELRLAREDAQLQVDELNR